MYNKWCFSIFQMQNNPKMGRPKKDPSEKLKVISTMKFIANVLRLTATGYSFEKYFEPNNFKESKGTGRLIYSGKWDRYFAKGVNPSVKSLACIEQKCPAALKHYNSPFWEAIQVKEKSQSEWEAFYLKLDKQVTILVFEFINNPQIFDGRIKKENQPLVKLIRIGNDQAVAALIGLTRQFRENIFLHDYIETQLYNILFNFLSDFFSYDVVIDVYSYLFEYCLHNSDKRFRSSPWPNDAKTVSKMIAIEHKNLLIAEDLGMVATYEQRREFYFWKFIGDGFEIVKEMTNALYERKWILSNHPKGLKWLIHHLNKTCPKNRKLNTEYI